MKISRREFVFGVGAATVAGPGLAMRAPDKPRDKPNVLFIAIDDLNDYVGCLGGHPQTRTPNLDKLAGESMLFANAHCPAPACLPSRTAIMTGRAPWSTGVYVNGQHWRTVLPKAVTLPRHFMDHGYTCAGAGKLFHHSQPGFPG